jgi:hypothetical protein
MLEQKKARNRATGNAGNAGWLDLIRGEAPLDQSTGETRAWKAFSYGC